MKGQLRLFGTVVVDLLAKLRKEKTDKQENKQHFNGKAW
jgi:hypothetical protein